MTTLCTFSQKLNQQMMNQNDILLSMKQRETYRKTLEVYLGVIKALKHYYKHVIDDLGGSARPQEATTAAL